MINVIRCMPLLLKRSVCYRKVFCSAKRFESYYSFCFGSDITKLFTSKMPPKRKVTKPEIQVSASENGSVEDSGPTKPKKGKKELKETEGASNSHIVVKRGAKLKSEDNQTEEEVKVPLKKRGKPKADLKNKDETVDVKSTSNEVEAESSKAPEKKTRKKAETNQVKEKISVDIIPKENKKAVVNQVKEKNTEKTKTKEDTKAKVLKKKQPKKNEKVDVPTTSKQADTKKNTVTDWNDIIFNSDRKNSDGELPNLKIVSWNVDGIRAWIKKDGLGILEYDSPDIFCLQETKCSDDKLPEELSSIDKYHKFWCASKKNGYAGVGLLSKEKPIDVTYGIGNEEQDADGRCLTAEYEKFFIVNVYVPNSGRKLVTLDKRLEWNNIFKQFIKNLDKKKPVIICGDLNVAHNEIDLTNPKTNKRNAGFTDEEREGMTDFLNEGFIDSFRYLYPDQKDVYTFWTYIANARKKNVGWRLDYFLISKKLKNKLCDCVVLDKVFGSDHCPLTLLITI